MVNPAHYTYRVTWSADDNEFVGLALEFPFLSWLDADQDEAFRGIRALVADVVKDMEDSGDEVPRPLSERVYSGVFKLRIPPDVHRALAISAAEQNVSLNRLVSSRLS